MIITLTYITYMYTYTCNCCNINVFNVIVLNKTLKYNIRVYIVIQSSAPIHCSHSSQSKEEGCKTLSFCAAAVALAVEVPVSFWLTRLFFSLHHSSMAPVASQSTSGGPTRLIRRSWSKVSSLKLVRRLFLSALAVKIPSQDAHLPLAGRRATQQLTICCSIFRSQLHCTVSTR